jgi:CheY-like chemotaxis protein
MNPDSSLPDFSSHGAASGQPSPSGIALRGGQPSLPRPARPEAHILVVDDEPINAKVIVKYFAAFGYANCSIAESGQQALDAIAQSMPDLVLLDVFLGDLNGIEVLKQVRSLPGGKRLPVIILTASDDPDLKRVALELGAAGFLTKPVTQSELLAWAQKCLPAVA